MRIEPTAVGWPMSTCSLASFNRSDLDPSDPFSLDLAIFYGVDWRSPLSSRLVLAFFVSTRRRSSCFVSSIFYKSASFRLVFIRVLILSKTSSSVSHAQSNQAIADDEWQRFIDVTWGTEPSMPIAYKVIQANASSQECNWNGYEKAYPFYGERTKNHNRFDCHLQWCDRMYIFLLQQVLIYYLQNKIIRCYCSHIQQTTISMSFMFLLFRSYTLMACYGVFNRFFLHGLSVPFHLLRVCVTLFNLFQQIHTQAKILFYYCFSCLAIAIEQILQQTIFDLIRFGSLQSSIFRFIF